MCSPQKMFCITHSYFFVFDKFQIILHHLFYILQTLNILNTFLRWLFNAGMFDNSFSQICPSKTFRILVRINHNYKYQVLHCSFVSACVAQFITRVAAPRAERPMFEPLSDILIIHFFSYLIFRVVMPFFSFYLIVLYYYKIKIIGIDLFTVFYYIKFNLCILTDVPRISFDM